MKRDLVSILDLSECDLLDLIEDAERLKMVRREGRPHQFLLGKSLAMIFEKSSTRTRVSFETGMAELGGHALFLNAQDLQIGRGEEIRDTARVLSRYVSAVMIRAYRHQSIEEFARYSTVPVINGLSDREHPCQIIADLMTIHEHLGHIDDLSLAWIGDGNNVCNSLVLASGLAGYQITVASPDGYQPPEDIIKKACSAGGKVRVVSDPEEAVRDAQVVATDTWVSMGEEANKANRLRSFAGYTITRDLMKKAAPDALFMHCLPAHRGQEVAEEVIEGKQSVVFDEAENRLHAQKALLVKMLGSGL
jgi:ornithine carbamoyltransferase